jgi:phage portal protein BeeE
MFAFLRRMMNRPAKADPDRFDKAFGGGGSGPPVAPAPLLPQINSANLIELEKFTGGWVYAAMRPIAQRIAGQPIRVGHKVAPPAKPQVRREKSTLPHAGPPWLPADEVDQDPSHPLLDALASPNDYLVAHSLMFVTTCSLEAAGLAYWWVDEGPDGRTTIWYLAPHWVRPELPTEESDRVIKTYKVRVPGMLDEFDLDPEVVVRFHQPDLFDPFFGTISPLIAGLKAADTDHALQESQRRQFHQGASPGLILTAGVPPELSGVGQLVRPALTKEQRAQLISAINAQYRGFTNHGNPLILDAIITDAKKMSNTPAEMDYLGGGQILQKRINQSFGVNPIITGEIEDSNRASATIAGEHFCEYTVNPLAVLMSQTMTAFFQGYYQDPGLLVWIEPARTNDPDARRADLDQLIRAEAITKNELRAEHGLDPIPEGDEWVDAPPGLTVHPHPEGGAGATPADTFRRSLARSPRRRGR